MHFILFPADFVSAGIFDYTYSLTLSTEKRLLLFYSPETKINYDLPKDGNVMIKVFDNSGKEVMTLADGFKPAGYYTVRFNGSNLSSGIYFYTLRTFDNGKEVLLTKKMSLIK